MSPNIPLTARLSAARTVWWNAVARKSFASDSAWTAIGNFSVYAAQGLMLVLLARLADAATVGQFAYGMAITTPTFVLLGLQLRQVMLSDVSGKFSMSDALLLRIAGILIANITCITICFANSADLLLCVVTMSLAARSSFELAGDLIVIAYQRDNEYRRAGVSQFLRSAITTGLAIIPVLIWPTAASAAIATAVAALLSLVAIDNSQFQRLYIKIRGSRCELSNLPPTVVQRHTNTWTTQWQLLLRCVPISIVMMLVAVFANVPRYFIHSDLGETALGIYSALGFLTTAGTLIMAACYNTSLRQLSHFHAQGDSHSYYQLLMRLLRISLGIGGLLLLFSAIAGPAIVQIIFGVEYARHNVTLLWLVAAGAVSFISGALGTAVTAAQTFSMQMLAMLISVIACGFASWWLIPAYGLPGAAAATFAGRGVCVCVYTLLLPSVNRPSVNTI